MLRKTIYATLILIPTMGAALAQTDIQNMQDLQGGQNSLRTQQEKKNDGDIDRAYQSTVKRVPNVEKKEI